MLKSIVRKIGYCYQYFLVSIVLSFFSSGAFSQTASLNEIKSAYLISFFSYFTWQNEELISDYIIGVVGEDESFIQTLEEALLARRVNGKPVRIMLANDFEAMRKAHLLYVTPEAQFTMLEISVESRRSNTLLVADNQMDKNHFMLNLIQRENNTVMFEVNRPNIVYEGLTMDNNLLFLGGTELDVAELISSIEGEVLNKGRELEEMQASFLSLQQESQQQQNLINNQSVIIEEQSSTLTNSNSQLLKIEEQLNATKKQLADSLLLLAESDYSLQLRQQELDTRNRDVGQQASRIAENNSLLQRQELALAEQSQLLDSQSQQVNQQGLLLDNYRVLIEVGTLALLLFLGLIGMILRLHHKRVQANESLASQNAELEVTKIDLQRERDRADKANEAKGVFLTSLSHEIRSPMNAILGYSELLQANSGDINNQKKSLEAIQRNGQHLLTLINSVLDISKIEAGKVEMSIKDFDLSGLSNDVDAMFKGVTESLGVRFSIITDNNVPDYVRSDEGKIKQIIINLLSNAVKFTTEGEVKLNISYVESPQLTKTTEVRNNKQSQLLFRVQDTGCGIKDEHFESIFGAFEQTATGRCLINGTGLGLAISRYYAQLLGGDIEVSSKVDVGSTFTCSILVESCNIKVLSKPVNTDVVEGIKDCNFTYKILLADDREENRDLIVQMLNIKEFEFKEVENGEEAVEAYKQWQPDLILMDLSMPVRDGREATRLIKGDDPKECRIIAVTANVFEEQKQEILSIGADGFIRKPFTASELFEEIAVQLGLTYRYKEIETILLEKKKSNVSSNILNELNVATIKLDIEAMRVHINTISEEDSELSAHLLSLVEAYEFEQIERLIASEKARILS